MDVKLRMWQAGDAPCLAAIINNRRIQGTTARTASV
jgi:hypothetical protein